MSIRSVKCPGCGATANVPVAMTNVKCPSCGTVWNVNNPAAAKTSVPKTTATKSASRSDDSTGSVALIAGSVVGVVLLLAIAGVAAVVLNSDSPPPAEATATTAVEKETVKPTPPEPYRIIDLPEDQRKRIYNDYRQMARTTTEKPLLIPQGGVRSSVENMLDKTSDYGLKQIAALNDVTVDDIKEVIKEGDAKVWDDSPRSNATRGGKRVYSEEMSEGWEKNPNRK